LIITFIKMSLLMRSLELTARNNITALSAASKDDDAISAYHWEVITAPLESGLSTGLAQADDKVRFD